MMNNLFSIFDPTASFLHLPLNWMSMMIFSIVIFPTLWFFPSLPHWLLTSLLDKINTEFKIILQKTKSSILIFTSLFFLIMCNNVFGLVSYVFTSTSHLSTTLSLALPLWTSFLIFSVYTNIMKFMAHLVPSGTPPALMPFMVLIETVSNIIRPITLSVRLAANMIAGHLLLTLIGGQAPHVSFLPFIPIFIGQTLLMILEMAVAFIQAYVFTVLSSLYAAEAH